MGKRHSLTLQPSYSNSMANNLSKSSGRRHFKSLLWRLKHFGSCTLAPILVHLRELQICRGLKRLSRDKPGNSYWRARLNTVDLLIGLFCKKGKKYFQHKKELIWTSEYREVHHTDPSPSVKNSLDKNKPVCQICKLVTKWAEVL